MTIVTIHQAKTNLSKLIAAAEAGEEVVIARGKSPVVRLAPVVQPQASKRRYGALKGIMPIAQETAFAPLSDAELAEWGLA